MKLFIFLGLCLSLFSIDAAQRLEMDTTSLFKCTLSSRHHNRIYVEGQRIKKIFYPEGDISIRIEEESGQIFVQAMVDNPEETTVTIITAEGLVQDLELSFEDKASEILILKDKSSDESNCYGLGEMGCDDEITTIQTAINSLLSGTVPEDYIPVEDRQICTRIKRGVILKSIMRLVGPLYTIYVMTIENNGNRPECIYENEINGIDGEWVFLEKNEMSGNDKMLALIGVKTYEQQ